MVALFLSPSASHCRFHFREREKVRRRRERETVKSTVCVLTLSFMVERTAYRDRIRGGTMKRTKQRVRKVAFEVKDVEILIEVSSTHPFLGQMKELPGENQ